MNQVCESIDSNTQHQAEPLKRNLGANLNSSAASLTLRAELLTNSIRGNIPPIDSHLYIKNLVVKLVKKEGKPSIKRQLEEILEEL